MEITTNYLFHLPNNFHCPKWSDYVVYEGIDRQPRKRSNTILSKNNTYNGTVRINCSHVLMYSGSNLKFGLSLKECWSNWKILSSWLDSKACGFLFSLPYLTLLSVLHIYTSDWCKILIMCSLLCINYNNTVVLI